MKLSRTEGLNSNLRENLDTPEQNNKSIRNLGNKQARNRGEQN